MTDESDYKTRLINQCRKLGAYARRFEDRSAVGILDMVIIFQDQPVCFVEGKMIRNRTFKPTDRQWIEGNRVLALGGKYAIAAMVGWEYDTGLMRVGDWSRELQVRDCMYQLKGDDFATTLWRFIRDRSQPTSRQHIGRSETPSL